MMAAALWQGCSLWMLAVGGTVLGCMCCTLFEVPHVV